MKKNQKGFTLAELLIVVAVIAVLVAIAIPTFTNQLEKSRQAVDISNLRGAYAAAKLAAMDGTYVEYADNAYKTSKLTIGSVDLYYDPSDGKLYHASVAKQENTFGITGTPEGYSKATVTTVYANTSQLPDGCTYTTPITTGTGIIKVTITYAATGNAVALVFVDGADARDAS